jgi:hypothetical protein
MSGEFTVAVNKPCVYNKKFFARQKSLKDAERTDNCYVSYRIRTGIKLVFVAAGATPYENRRKRRGSTRSPIRLI